MKDLVLKSGDEDIVKVMSKQDLNKVTTNGSYISEDVADSIKLSRDSDSNNTITGCATIRVISNDAHTKVSRDLIELSKGYKYVYSTNDRSN